MANHKSKKKLQEKKYDFEDFRINVAVYQTCLTNKYINRKPYEAPNPKMIKAFMPGTIRDVFVEKSQEVEPETKLCILEAMKMKNMIFPPFKGIIKEIYVKPGQMVSKNHVLVELE
jgi:biotin carboxyl carrier protein